jgi:hypothetical protein
MTSIIVNNCKGKEHNNAYVPKEGDIVAVDMLIDPEFSFETSRELEILRSEKLPSQYLEKTMCVVGLSLDRIKEEYISRVEYANLMRKYEVLEELIKRDYIGRKELKERDEKLKSKLFKGLWNNLANLCAGDEDIITEQLRKVFAEVDKTDVQKTEADGEKKEDKK